MKQKTNRKIGVHIVLWLFLIPSMLPFVLMLLISLKDKSQYYQQRFTLSFPLHFDNYSRAWTVIKPMVVNSIFTSTISMLLTTVIACMAAYSFAKIKFAGKNFLFVIIVSSIMFPQIFLIIPTFILTLKLHINNTNFGLWSHWISGANLGIGMMTMIFRTYFSELPHDLFESSRIDGASEIRNLRHIVIPLSLPIISTFALLNFYVSWNDLLWPIIVFTDQEHLPISAGLVRFTGQFSTDQGGLFAGYTLASIPLVLLFMLNSKNFINGLTAGASKE